MCVSAAYANIDVQLKKRYDRIPNLVNSVREYMKYEKETLEKLISLRTKAVSNKTQSGEILALDKEISHLIFYEIEDKPLEENVIALANALSITIEILESPMFLDTRNDFYEYTNYT